MVSLQINAQKVNILFNVWFICNISIEFLKKNSDYIYTNQFVVAFIVSKIWGQKGPTPNISNFYFMSHFNIKKNIL